MRDEELSKIRRWLEQAYFDPDIRYFDVFSGGIDISGYYRDVLDPPEKAEEPPVTDDHCRPDAA